MNLNFLRTEIPVKLFDMSIEDVDERRNKALSFPTVTAAANFLGYTTRQLYDRMNRKIGDKRYAYHRETKKQYAIRPQSKQTA